MNRYISVAQAAQKWGLSPRRIYTLCTDGRIPGAMHFVRSWAIPEDAEKPADARIKHGKYTGVSEKYRKKKAPVGTALSGVGKAPRRIPYYVANESGVEVPPSPARTILVVDDSAINRAILTRILTPKYAVLEAEEGRQALDLLKEYRGEIVAVMLDLAMPVMDGYTTLEMMKKNSRYDNLPIVVTTGSGNRDSERRA
ncbi:MAG: response regulator, partial [Oscillospiraceae bacterium]